MTTLAELIRERAAAERAAAPERQRKLSDWQLAAEGLLQRIEGWVRQADTEHILQIERTVVMRSEEGLGAYTASGLRITLGLRCVDITPVARNVAGAVKRDGEKEVVRLQGRVDITEGPRRHRVYRLGSANGEEWAFVQTTGARALRHTL